MELGLKGRTAIVTGASKGIGEACAKALAREGVALFLVARTLTDLDRLAVELRSAHGVRVETLALDLGLSESVDKLVRVAPDADILVNNAGAIPAGSIDAVDEATWRQAWELKVFGYINLMRAYNAAMRQRGNGVIVNILGAGGERPSATYAADRKSVV